jgi:hypothetical protein
MSTIFTTEIGIFDSLSGNSIQTTGAASFENINFNYSISGNTGIFNNNVFIDNKEVSTKEYVNQEISSLHSIDLSISGDISSLAVRDTGFYNQITGLLGEDLDFGTDVSSLNAKDNSLESDISSLSVRDTGFYNQITGLLGEDLDFGTDVSSLNAKDNSLESDISSLAVRDTGFYNQITGLLGEDLDFETDVSSLNFQTESFFNSSNNELFSTSGTFSQALTLNGEPVLTGVIDGNIDWKSTPPTSTSLGQEGEVAYDSGYMYICITNNNWRRLAISDF